MCILITFLFFQNPSLKPKLKDGEEESEGTSQEPEVSKMLTEAGSVLLCVADSALYVLGPLAHISKHGRILLCVFCGSQSVVTSTVQGIPRPGRQ